MTWGTGRSATPLRHSLKGPWDMDTSGESVCQLILVPATCTDGVGVLINNVRGAS